MRLSCSYFFLAFCLLIAGQSLHAQSPLAEFGAGWSDARFDACNTAANTTWLSKEERQIIYLINIVRRHPQLFLQQVVEQWPTYKDRPGFETNNYYRSLCDDLEKQQPMPLLQPDSLLWVSARCHAVSSGRSGYTGHDRQTASCAQKEKFEGECCNYGSSTALEVVMELLIDEDVPSLGHRKILLRGFNRIGVSMQPHSTYRFNTVLDFAGTQ
jgi:hypothetical protein